LRSRDYAAKATRDRGFVRVFGEGKHGLTDHPLDKAIRLGLGLARGSTTLRSVSRRAPAALGPAISDGGLGSGSSCLGLKEYRRLGLRKYRRNRWLDLSSNTSRPSLSRRRTSLHAPSRETGLDIGYRRLG
jgi:hypothetical protein